MSQEPNPGSLSYEYISNTLQKHSLDSGIIYLWGDIDEPQTSFVIEQMEYLLNVKKHKDVHVYIHSQGGHVDCECAILDQMQILKKSGVVVHTHVLGCAYSAAATLLTLGSTGYRTAREYSNVMLHPCSYALESDYSTNQEKLTAFIKKKADLINKLVADSCGMGKKYKKFLQDIDKGIWLTGKEILNYGIVDKIEYGYNKKS